MNPNVVETPAPDVPVRARDFSLLWSGSAISMVGTVSATTAGPLLALASARSPVLAGWVAFAGTLPGMLFHLPVGVLVDRLDRRLTMVVSQIFLALAGFAMAGALFMGAEPAPVLLVGAVIQDTCIVCYSMAEVAFIPRIVPPRQLPEAMGKNEVRNHVAQLLGHPLGGLLFSVDRAFPFLASAGTSTVSLLTLAFVRGDRRGAPASLPDPERSVVLEVKESLAWILKDSFLRLALLVFMVTNFLFQAVSLLLVVMAKRAGLSSSLIGVLLAAPGVGGAAGAAVAPRVLQALLSRTTLRTFVSACVWGWLCLLLAIAASGQWIVWLCAWAGVGFIGAHMNVALATHQVTVVPPGMLGRVAGANNFAAQGVIIPVGALFGAYLISWVGARPSAMAVALAMLCFAVLVSSRRILLRRISSYGRDPAGSVRRKKLRPPRAGG